jgi:dual specificity MAP kinase phosphatase
MDFSKITEDLFIGIMPGVVDYGHLRALGVRLVINMRSLHPPLPDPHQPPFDFVWLPSLDTMFLPIPIPMLVHGARKALQTIEGGGKVYSHCGQGRHRAVAMGASVLIAQGYEPQAAIELIKSQRAVADPDIFYIRRQILKFAREWHGKKDLRVRLPPYGG